MAAKYINIDSNNLTIYGLVSKREPNNIKYIGITRRNPSYRLNNHLFEARKTPEKNRRTKWIYENNFEIEQIILDVCPEADIDFKLLEKYWISLIKSWGFDLVNSNNGGGGTLKRDKEFSNWLSSRNIGNKYNLGKKRSDEAKKNISLGHIGIESPNKGKKLNKEWVEKLRQAKIGKVSNAKGFKHTEETKNKKRKTVLVIDKNLIIINKFNSVSETAEYFNITMSMISRVLDKEKQYKGFYFKTNKNER